MATMQKITVSLPKDLLAFADIKAFEQGVSRSKFITDLLATFKMSQEDVIAAEGYQFYAQESEEFAIASQQATLEGWEHGR